MPKPTKLHAKGKSTSIQKPCKIDKDATDDNNPEESLTQFQLELCWCIQQLEKNISDKKGNEKQLQEAWKVLTVLKNNNQPMVRKRQLMRTHFGDYRAKMAAEEKKLAKMASKMKITDTPAQPKATFLRKSAFLSTGDNSFKFDFHLLPDQLNASNSENNGGQIDPITSLANTAQPGHSKILDSGDNTQSGGNNEGAKKFKFMFTNTEFKFNFDAQNDNS